MYIMFEIRMIFKWPRLSRKKNLCEISDLLIKKTYGHWDVHFDI